MITWIVDSLLTQKLRKLGSVTIGKEIMTDNIEDSYLPYKCIRSLYKCQPTEYGIQAAHWMPR